jgi:hypothetical protein
MKKITVFILLIAACLLTTGCLKKYTLSNSVPDAENALFTDCGRLFVTGGNNMFEIKADGIAQELFNDSNFKGYNFTGMAQAGDFLYAIGSIVAFDFRNFSLSDINFSSPEAVANFAFKLKEAVTDTVLMCAEIDAIVPGQGQTPFRVIHTFENTLIPNGMVADSSGNLYVADETFLPTGKIMRLHIDDLNNPMSVIWQETWLDSSDNVLSPNGMSIKDDTIYFTDFNISRLANSPASVKKVSISNVDACAAGGNNDCSGCVLSLYNGSLLYDDLSVGTLYGYDLVAVASFFKGSLLFVEDNEQNINPDPNGKNQKNYLHESRHGMFSSPSSVIFGKAPMFSNDELITTEKGIMTEMFSTIGNKVSVVYKK